MQKVQVQHDTAERNFSSVLIEDSGDHFMVEGRYAIYKNDGCIYDTIEAADIPMHIFEVRDELLPQHSSEVEMGRMTKVQCVCEGTGYISQVDRTGEDTELVECASHHPAYQDPRNLK